MDGASTGIIELPPIKQLAPSFREAEKQRTS